MMMKLKKKPVEVRAMRFDGTNFNEIVAFTSENHACTARDFDGMARTCVIPTLEGNKVANAGDYIIRGTHGEFYPCPAENFGYTHVSGNTYRKNVAGGDVTGIQFVGDNAEEVIAFTSAIPERTGQYFNHKDGGIIMIPRPGSDPYICRNGDYVIHDGDSMRVCNVDIFNDLYDVIEED